MLLAGSQDGYSIIASGYFPTRFPFLYCRGYVKPPFLRTLRVYCWADSSKEKFTPNGFAESTTRSIVLHPLALVSSVCIAL